MKTGILYFFKERDQTINLLVNMFLWFIVILNYQINDYYDYFFPGDQYQALIVLSTVELIAYIVAD